MDALIFYIVKAALLVLVAWGIISILGITLPFWSLVGLSLLAGEFLALGASKKKDDE